MAANGRSPSLAMPPENVTACSSLIPTSNTRSGIASCMIFIEVPEAIAAVTPTIRLSARASSSSVWPNTS